MPTAPEIRGGEAVSRSGYTDDCDGSELAMWRGVIASASRGKRGQKFFRDLLSALDAMPKQELIAGDLETTDGEVCALGALGRRKGVDVESMDTYDWSGLSETFDIAPQLAQETMYENDDGGPISWPTKTESPAERWKRMRAWAVKNIRHAV